jgi:hypothetical protein
VQALPEALVNSSGTYELPAAEPAAALSSVTFSSDDAHAASVRPGWPAVEAPALGLALTCSDVP